MDELDVSDCGLDDSDLHEVTELVRSCPSLAVLDLRYGGEYDALNGGDLHILQFQR